MNNTEAIEILKEIIENCWLVSDIEKHPAIEACEKAIDSLEKLDKVEKLLKVGVLKDCESCRAEKSCTDAISRQEALDLCERFDGCVPYSALFSHDILPSVSTEKTGWCKDCKWWKDSDGAYRRGSHAESQCPINRKEVYEGNGYCFMFELQESGAKMEVEE